MACTGTATAFPSFQMNYDNRNSVRCALEQAGLLTWRSSPGAGYLVLCFTIFAVVVALTGNLRAEFANPDSLNNAFDLRELRLSIDGTATETSHTLTVITDAPEDWEVVPDWTKATSALAELKAIRGWCMAAACGVFATFGAVLWHIGFHRVRI